MKHRNPMPLVRFHLLVFFALLALLCGHARAQSVPTLINYQGQLANPDGTPLPTADYELRFSIYDAAQGGNLIWGPQVFDGQSGPGHGLKIPVVQGFFNVMLGPVDTASVLLAGAFEATSRFVEIKVGTNNPVAPRQQILSAPYALKAGNSDKLAGYDWSSLLNTNDPVNGRLSGAKIADGSVTTTSLAANAVANSKLASSSVDTRVLANSAVTAAQIQDGTIVNSKLASSSVDSRVLGSLVVATSQIQDGAVTSAKIADGNISAAKLATSAVTSSALAPNSVLDDKILNGNVTTSKLGDASVTTVKLADGSVTSAKLVNGCVWDQKILDGNVITSKLGDLSVTTVKLADGSVTSAKLSSQLAQDAVIPPGTVMAYFGTTAPAGWLMCDGSELNRSTYARLFSVTGTCSGGGNGSTTFTLPDLRGMFLRGVNGTKSGQFADPESGNRQSQPFYGNWIGNSGNNVGSYQSDAFMAHNHKVYATDGGGPGSQGTRQTPDPQNNGLWTNPFSRANAATDVYAAEELSPARTSSESRPMNVYVNYIIKY